MRGLDLDYSAVRIPSTGEQKLPPTMKKPSLKKKKKAGLTWGVVSVIKGRGKGSNSEGK